MASTITVMYENVDDATFDLEYYLSKHMPFVQTKFAPFGIKGWRVIKGVDTPTGEKPRYSIIALLEFDTGQQFKDGVAAAGKEVFGDVPNFSNKSPVVVIGDVVGSSS